MVDDDVVLKAVDFTDRLPGVLTIEGGARVSRLMSNGELVVSVDMLALERQGFNPFIFVRLISFATLLLKLLISAHNLIALIGLEWDDLRKTGSFLTAIEDPNSIKVEV